VLSPGATVQFGNATLTFSGEAPAGEAAAPADVTVVVGTPPSAISELDVESPAAETGTEAEATPQAQPNGVAILRPTAGDGAPINVQTGTFTIGRRDGNDIVIPNDPYISGAHAMLQTDDSGSFLTDVGSTNGTTVNGVRLDANSRQQLMEGDEVTLGQTTYRFEPVQVEEPAAEAEKAEEATTDGADDPAAGQEAGADPEEVAG
jgi:pSer/pThr/pTyr-binding forkhead associated (FHA) protein